jgi:peptidoglycan/xylan/chitin deacetylase (PgdA/CDA1 family)
MASDSGDRSIAPGDEADRPDIPAGGERLARRELAWPVDRQVYLTLDFECDYGTALEHNAYEAVTHVDKLVALLERLDVPLTAFVQTELFDEQPEAVETLRDGGVDVQFHPHSHTHRGRDHTGAERDHERTRWEIETSTERYREFFGCDPVGYRFPDGNVRRTDYELLAAAGYEFDASVFPSWRPGRFDNSDEPTVPAYLPDHDLVEVPFTVFDERLRVPTALSYCQLLGRPYTDLLVAHPPSVVMFNIHMHDLVTPSSYADLPRFYRAVYARNPDGFAWLERVLTALDDRGYSFSVVDHVHDVLRERL